MKRRTFLTQTALSSGVFFISNPIQALANQGRNHGYYPKGDYDILIVGGTPGGIMSAISAARNNATVLLLERTNNIGGLPANGLGATDIGTRNATGGLFLEFVNRIENYYIHKYGGDSQQVKDCSNGYHFEPSVAEKIFEEMLTETKGITVLKMRQFDSDPANLKSENFRINEIMVLNRINGVTEKYKAGIFIDATYEGDLAAAAGIPYFLGREGRDTYNELYAGKVYKTWRGGAAPGSTFQSDNAIQSYNYRLCLTQDPSLKIPIQKPKTYDRREYESIIDDVETGRTIDITTVNSTASEREKNRRRVQKGLPPILPDMPRKPEGMQRIVNKVNLPNNKVDANNQHLAFLSTDLPEENWPWPTSFWEWRDRFADRLRNYTLGLLWFAQNDPGLPEWFKNECRKWGLAKDEYSDNENFPRQVYVREGRRMKGLYFFTQRDARPEKNGERPTLHENSITASHYALDSHAVRKREKGKMSLDGILSYSTQPYTIPYGVMVPEKIENVLMPVPASASHIGLATLRMEPCWMALGQAAGAAAVLSLREKVPVQNVEIGALQNLLLKQKSILIYFKKIPPDDPQYPVLQYLALKGAYTSWEVNLEEPITEPEIDFIKKSTKFSNTGKWVNTPPTRRQAFSEIMKTINL